jgi:hypothetical protein
MLFFCYYWFLLLLCSVGGNSFSFSTTVTALLLLLPRCDRRRRIQKSPSCTYSIVPSAALHARSHQSASTSNDNNQQNRFGACFAATSATAATTDRSKRCCNYCSSNSKLLVPSTKFQYCNKNNSISKSNYNSNSSNLQSITSHTGSWLLARLLLVVTMHGRRNQGARHVRQFNTARKCQKATRSSDCRQQDAHVPTRGIE